MDRRIYRHAGTGDGAHLCTAAQHRVTPRRANAP